MFYRQSGKEWKETRPPPPVMVFPGERLRNSTQGASSPTPKQVDTRPLSTEDSTRKTRRPQGFSSKALSVKTLPYTVRIADLFWTVDPLRLDADARQVFSLAPSLAVICVQRLRAVPPLRLNVNSQSFLNCAFCVCCSTMTIIHDGLHR